MAGIAVYVCDCAGRVSDHLDTAALQTAAAELEGVAFVHRVDVLCSRAGLAGMEQELRRAGADALLFAGCSPRMSLKLPEEALVAAAARAGIDPARVEVANVREGCAWLHRDDPEGAGAKARDQLRMAYARLVRGAPSPAPVALQRRALVVGAGPAGLAATSELARAGIETVLVERNEYLGGKLCQLPVMWQTEGWPSVCESQCVGPVQARDALFDPAVTFLCGAELQALQRHDGNFTARIALRPAFVDDDLCIACGKCEEVCPEVTSSAFELGHGERKAISKPFQRAVPDRHVVLEEACTRCGECVPVCPTGAIDLDAGPRTVEEQVGAVIVATGTDPRDVRTDPELGGGHPDVITAMELERLLATGLRRPSDGGSPEHVVFVQCAGSRAGMDKQGSGVEYCSRTCCAVTAKQAKRIAATAPMTEVSIVYYRDFRTYERALEKLSQDVRGMGLEFHNGEVTAIEPGEDGGLAVEIAQLATEELEDAGARETLHGDLVVLACAQEPRLPAAARQLGMPLDRYGFAIETQPRIFRPTESFVDRVYVAGAAAGPKAIQPSVEQGKTAALEAIQALSTGQRQPPKHCSEIDTARCCRCGTCVSVCPHGAIQLGDDGAVVDPGFCQACGMCAASCPSQAASLRNFGDAAILAEVDAAFRELPAGEPRILVLLCYWCSYGAADLAGTHGLTAPACARTVRTRCSSSVHLGLISEMFRRGVDGVIVAGCPPNSCHHMWGNWVADKRIALFKTMMRDMGLDERRLRFEYWGIMNDREFAEGIGKLRGVLQELGPNPWLDAERGPAGTEAAWLAR